MWTRRSAFASAGARNRTALIRLKIAVFAPVPRPRMRIDAAANGQSRTRRRSAYRKVARCGVETNVTGVAETHVRTENPRTPNAERRTPNAEPAFRVDESARQTSDTV
jgi:hypothetical protein